MGVRFYRSIVVAQGFPLRPFAITKAKVSLAVATLLVSLLCVAPLAYGASYQDAYLTDADGNRLSGSIDINKLVRGIYITWIDEDPGWFGWTDLTVTSSSGETITWYVGNLPFLWGPDFAYKSPAGGVGAHGYELVKWQVPLTLAKPPADGETFTFSIGGTYSDPASISPEAFEALGVTADKRAGVGYVHKSASLSLTNRGTWGTKDDGGKDKGGPGAPSGSSATQGAGTSGVSGGTTGTNAGTGSNIDADDESPLPLSGTMPSLGGSGAQGGASQTLTGAQLASLGKAYGISGAPGADVQGEAQPLPLENMMELEFVGLPFWWVLLWLLVGLGVPFGLVRRGGALAWGRFARSRISPVEATR